MLCLQGGARATVEVERCWQVSKHGADSYVPRIASGAGISRFDFYSAALEKNVESFEDGGLAGIAPGR